MVLLKTLLVSLLVGTAFAASTLASLAPKHVPDHVEVMKSDLPVITTAMLPVGMDANPYPPNYAADIAFVADDENCDEMEAFDAVAQVEAVEAFDVAQSLRPKS